MENEKKFKSIESQRFINAVSLIIDKGLAKSFKEVAEKSGYSSQDFTDIKAGKKDLQRRFLQSVCNKFPINEDFVMTGKGEILNNEVIEQEKEQEIYGDYLYHKKQYELFQELIKSKEDLIEMLKQKIKDLESR